MDKKAEEGKEGSGDLSKEEPNEWTAYCDKCGKAFNPNDAIRVPYQEYLGASFSYEEVSPCCGVGYSDRPKEEEKEGGGDPQKIDISGRSEEEVGVGPFKEADE